MHYSFLTALRRLLPALVCCTLFSLSYATADPGITVWHGDRQSLQIAITVDDCYDRDHLAAAITLCETYNIPFTFFPVGNALKYADGPLWQRALDAGCEIGNHSWSHKNLTRCSPPTVRFQLLRTQQKLDELLGYHYPMQVMRPPYGETNGRVADAASSVGYARVVNWDVSQTDPAQALTDVQNGSILLYHARGKDIRCLEALIPQLLEAGYECVTVSQLLGLEPVVPSPGIYFYKRSDAYL